MPRIDTFIGADARNDISTSTKQMGLPPGATFSRFEPHAPSFAPSSHGQLTPTVVHSTPDHAPVAVTGGTHHVASGPTPGGGYTYTGPSQPPTAAPHFTPPAPFTQAPHLVSLLGGRPNTRIPGLTPLLSSLLPNLAPAPLYPTLFGKEPTLTQALLPGLEKKTLGEQSLSQVLAAEHAGTLKTNAAGQLTTPATRSAAQGLAAAQEAFRAHALPNLAGLSPAERSDALLAIQAHKEYPDIPASVLVAQDKQESGFNPLAISSANAQGLSQFIPGTAAQYGVHFGSSHAAQQSQVSGQAHYLHDLGFAQNPQKALSGYSGGYAANAYNNPVLQGAKAYSALDRSTVVPPGVRQQYKAAADQARDVGIHPSPPLAAGHQAPGSPYANPLPANAWAPGRTDQGFDASPLRPNAPILATGRGRVVAIGAPGWPEGGGVTYRLTQGPQRGKEIYNFEGLNPVAKLDAGDVLHRGEVIARGRQGGSIETGYYQGNPTVSGHPLHNQLVSNPGVTYSVAGSDGQPTLGALQFEHQILGHAAPVSPSGAGAAVSAGGVGAGVPGTAGSPGLAAAALASGQHGAHAVQLMPLTPPNAAGPVLPSQLLNAAASNPSAAAQLLALLNEPAQIGALFGHRPALG